ncbi:MULTISPECIES: DegQ family serine endoprotease [unclassified Campylobacter]|uniref:DegQ family serine endoprotease n=1 Tax=unclassified Campylobacter TaxID=2593542 RepID=UPI0022EA0F54|nr:MULTISPECIES: DegQ family serine endoprotease [unclassified Campylobacter]MDA3042935.1 DegQ family serine endoprotease [Campylobacter sp. JMF_09 ED2]MDA3044230.1 DegQ family serine endoprotease [Campylobacter sp. JMF_07 ED4]MDA3063579.1 DegQ family serine endoprotease [Campylobacter sp. JMF_11 EL3]MDA3071205.1 DegQ family serine endoprotease [Campylobacter sp. VBCF_03 NA9]MDA3074665.1 DegQ family serine endoprotease [Campylobacter sp. JMF_05 ED3]
MKKTILLSLALSASLFGANIDISEAGAKFDRVNPEFSKDVVLSYHSSIAEAKKSVVNISTKSKHKVANNPMAEMFNDPFFKQFFDFNLPRQEREVSSLGSGVIISDDGYIVTNNHVVENADEIVVTLLDNDKEYKAKVVGTDSKTDLAIIKIEEKRLSAIKFADSSMAVEGDIVFAIGNPFGVGGTITQGIISALNKNNIGLNQYENFIQTDASINPGNSGGALVDSRGALIGINSAILSRSGGNNGIGFAIPSNMVKDIAKKLISDGKIERGYIGVTISDMSKEQKEIYNSKEGALISSVEEGLPADKAGIKRGDLIIKVDDKPVKNANELKNLVGSMNPGSKVEIEFERDGKNQKVTLKLDSMDKSSNAGSSNVDEGALEGLSLKNLDDEIRSKYALNKDLKGAIVTNVKADSKASEYGFRKGDIIIQIGQNDVENIDDFNKYIKAYKGKKVLVWVIRNGIPQGLVIR